MKTFIDVFYTLSIMLFAIFIVVFVVFGIYFFRVKIIYAHINSGKINLEKSVEEAKQKKFSAASEYAKKSQENFKLAHKKLSNLNNPVFKKIDYLNSQILDAQKLLIAAEIISRGISKGTKFGADIFANMPADQVKLTDDQRTGIIKILYEGIPEISGIKSDIELAVITLDQIQYKYLISSYKEKIVEFKGILEEAESVLDSIIPLIHLISPITGYPEKSNFLVLMQNKDELRPTGGFIGTFGIVEVESGKINSFNTHDVYHLDMPVQDKINVIPPEPIRKYLGVDKWYFRDSNWSPDWSKSAQVVQDFYRREKKLLPDDNEIKKYPDNLTGVIAITPYLVISLLDLTGPIIIEGQEYNKENFIDLLEYRVEKGYVNLGVPKWERKEIIGELVKEIKTRLFDVSGLDIFSVYKIFNKNILNKNILVYLNNDVYQKQIVENNLSGGIAEVEGDYLMVVDANMAAAKTDAVMERDMRYSLTESKNNLISKLKINYKHTGEFNWKTTRYRTYTRIYVPLGSELIKANGYSEDDIQIYNEDNKTVFAVFLSVEPGDQGELSFEYKLPDKIYNIIVEKNNYSLFTQKQPGNNYKSFNVNLDFDNKIKKYNPSGISIEGGGESSVNWEKDFDRDYLFQVNF